MGGMGTRLTFKPKEKERGVRATLARWLVKVAQRLYPESKEVMAFYTQMIHDSVIYGQAVVRVDPMDTKYVDEK